MWQDEVSHLNLLDQNPVERGKIGGVFLLLGFILGLRVIQMDRVFGAVNGRAVQSQKFGTECWNFQDCFGQSGARFLGLFLDSPVMDFRDCFGQSRTEFVD